MASAASRVTEYCGHSWRGLGVAQLPPADRRAPDGSAWPVNVATFTFPGELYLGPSLEKVILFLMLQQSIITASKKADTKQLVENGNVLIKELM